jgi:hypothetical protein
MVSSRLGLNVINAEKVTVNNETAVKMPSNFNARFELAALACMIVSIQRV